MNDTEYKKDLEAKQAVFDKLCKKCKQKYWEACMCCFDKFYICKKAQDEVNKIKENL